MRSRWIIAAVCLLATMSLSRVEMGQALPAGVGPGTYVRVGGGVSAFKLGYGQHWLGGAQGWVDANPFWNIGLEAEARWLRYNQDENVHATTYMVGPRWALHYGALEPYAKVLAGSGQFNFPFNYARGTYFVAAGGGGVDFHIGERWQVRAVDVEYQVWPKFTFGQMKSYGVSAGISYTLFHGNTRRTPQ